MENNLPFHIRMYNERVRAMNQSNAKILTLNAQEARNLHSEIYDLMAGLATIINNPPTTNSIEINMDGGGFK